MRKAFHAIQTLSSKTVFVERNPMLNLTAIFLVIALLAAVLGGIGVAAAAVSIAKVCFVIFVVLFFASLLTHAARDI